MSTYSSNLKIELIGTGEQVGTWGTTTNSNFSNVFEQSIVGRVAVNFATDANRTLSASDSVASQDFRNVYLNLTSSGSLSATRDLIVPTINKNYVIQNNTTGGQSIRVITAAGTGITVPNGTTVPVYVDGTNVIQAFDFLPTFNIGTLDLTTIEVTNIRAKDGTASISLADSTGIATFSKATVIETTDNTNAALRITQLGTGNALLVEDSTNPDSTPFVIDASGKVIAGSTATVVMPSGDGGLYGAGIEALGASGGTASIGAALYNNAAIGFGGALSLAKSNSATVGSHGLVTSGEVAGAIYFSASDGTNFIRTAQITSSVDGTPGTNDMPGRLVFFTTADGASSPTERMRIDSAGNISLGGGSIAAGRSVTVNKNLTGAVGSIGVFSLGTVQSDVTSEAIYFRSSHATVAASFTTNIKGFEAVQGTIGAGSTVTNQYGFIAGSTLIGATNNYGFFSNIASGTGRWNFYANGTADNYFGGRLGVGIVPNQQVDIASTGLGLGVARFTTSTGTGGGIEIRKSASATVGTNTILANGETIGRVIFAGADGTSYPLASEIRVEVDGTPGTNDMPGRLIFSTTADGASTPTERMRITSDGNVLIGDSTSRSSLGYAQGVQLSRVSGTLGQFRWSTDNGAPELVSSKARGTSASPTIVASGDGLWLGRFAGYDGANYVEAARIAAEVDGTPGTNDMPGRLIFFTTADGASSPTERMRITNQGLIGIGGTPSSNMRFVVGGAQALGANPQAVLNQQTLQSDATGVATYYDTFANLQATAFNLTTLNHYRAVQNALSGGATITNQRGFAVESNLTGATNNFGFFSNIASGTGRWNFYANGTADNYFAGNTTIAGITTLGATINTGLGITTGSAVLELGILRTGDGNAYIDFHSVAGGDFQARIIKSSGANSNFSVTNEGTGVLSLSQTGAGVITLNTNGSERLRANSVGQVAVVSAGSASAPVICKTDDLNTGIFFPAADTIAFAEGGVESMRIDSSGRLLVGTTSASGSNLLQVNSDALIQGLTVGRGAGALSNNTVVGAGALATNTTGASNIAFGQTALTSNTTGSANSALGREAMYSNTTGGSNTAVGNNAMFSNTTGGGNTAVGHVAMTANTTGSNNVSLGVSALQSNTTASNNTAVGFQAAFSTTTGIQVTAIGSGVLYNNTAQSNTGVGYFALRSNTSGTNNVAVGADAAGGFCTLQLNTTGSGNTAVGNGALGQNTTASNNTAVGFLALYANTTGTANVAVGRDCMPSNTTGIRNVAMGNGSLQASTTGSNNVSIGADALFYATTASNNTAIGNSAGVNITTGAKNTIIGNYTGNSGGLDIRTASNYIVMSDGDGSIGMYVRTTVTPSTYLIYMQSGAGTNALRWNTTTGQVTYDTSSARYKDNIRDSVYGLNAVMQMRSAQFEYKDDGRSDVGLIAEELQPIIPELVGVNKEGLADSVSYDRLVSVCIKAIQELKAEFDAYKATHP